MGWSLGDEKLSARTYTILTALVVAVALALLSIPGLDPAWREASIVVLSILALLNFLAYLGLANRFSLWTKERGAKSRINRKNGLAYELRNIVALINATFYEEQPGTLLYLARTVDSHATSNPQLTQVVFRASREGSVFLDLSYNTKRWEANAFWAFIRRLCMHFDTADFV